MKTRQSPPGPGQTLFRTASISREAVDEKTKRVRVSFSSETDTVRFWGTPQILLHEKGAADFSRLASVLLNHDPNQVVGRAEGVELDLSTRKGRGSIVFDDDPESLRIFRKVAGGSIQGVSVGFRVDAWQVLDEGDSWQSPEGRSFQGPADIATRWRAIEFSVTPIPADGSVGVGRNIETATSRKAPMNMSDETITQATEIQDIDPAAAERRAERRERDRVRDIRGVCHLLPETRAAGIEDVAIEEGWTVERVRAACLKAVADARPMLHTEHAVTFGEDARDKFERNAVNSLLVRAGRKLPEKESRDLHYFSLIELARSCLERAHVKTALMNGAEIATRAFSHSTSDFPGILSNTANKALLTAWEESPATYQPLCKVVPAGDFKTMYRHRLGDSGALEETPDLAPMPEGSIAENSESYSIATYSKRFGISRQAIVNDDLSAFNTIPTLMAQAARRTVNKLFWDLLVSAAGVGPTMAEDSEALFSTAHTSGANYNTGAFAISVDNLSAAKKFMRRQKGLVATGETAPILNVQPRFLVVPAALEGLALQTVASITPVTTATAVPGWISALEVICEPQLDDATNGTTAWYLAAQPATFPGFEMAFLNGNEAPQLIRVDGTNILGVEWGVYVDVGVHACEHRSWFRARGA